MEIQQNDDFTLKGYSLSIDVAIKNGYLFFPLKNISDAKKSDKSIILRHDVDTQLDTAIQVGRIEQAKNIEASYFIRFHSHSYNPLCIKDAYKIKELSLMGHEIGLHYEPDYYNLLGMDFENFFSRELDFLSGIIGKQIISIAPHEPTRTGMFRLDKKTIDKNNIKFEAYSEEILENFKYISDSSCRWRDGSLYYHVKNAEHKKLYVLTHPYWWYNNSPIENY